MTAEPKNDLRAAVAKRVHLRSEVRRYREAVATIKKRMAEAEHGLARAKERFGKEAADDVAKGLPIRENGRLRTQIVRGEAEIAGCKAALPAAADAVKAAETVLAVHDRLVAAAALDVTCAVQADALDELTEAIGGLCDPLAALAASAMIREQLLGDRFANPRGVEVLGGREIVAAFVECLPARLKPAALSMPAIEQKAQEIAQAQLAVFESKEIENV